MNLDEWRARQQGEDYTLPSGLDVRLKKVALLDLVQRGQIPDTLKKMYVLRRILNPMGTVDAIEFLLDKLRQTKSNGEFFDSMNT